MLDWPDLFLQRLIVFTPMFKCYFFRMENLINHLRNCLCPPGHGVYTVQTASELKESLNEKLFRKKNDVHEIWSEGLEALKSNNTLILGICSDTGGGILRGANWGPLFLRNELYQKNSKIPQVFDLGDIRVIPHLLHDKYLNEKTIKNCQKALYDGKEYPVSGLSIAEFITESIHKNFPHKRIFGIGGDHSCSYPLVKSYLESKKEMGKKAALIHFDAHTDLLVERLGIDICFGSWTAQILKYLDSPGLCHQIGIRSSGKNQSHWESTFGVKQYWANEVSDKGPESIADTIIESLKENKVDELYVSFDIDAIDSSYVSSTGTPEPEGLLPHEPIVILKKLAKEFPITGADIMELAPFIGRAEDNSHSLTSTLMVSKSISEFLLESLSKE